MLKVHTLIAIAATLIACTKEPEIRSAWAERLRGDSILVHVRTSPRDAQFIKRNQVYFSIVLKNCGDASKRFPMEPMIQGRRVSDFDFEIADSGVEFTSSSPAWVLKQYNNPCITLEGGGYSGARLRSRQTPLNLNKLAM